MTAFAFTEIDGVAWCLAHDSWWCEGDASCHADWIEGADGTGGCIEAPLYHGSPNNGGLA